MKESNRTILTILFIVLTFVALIIAGNTKWALTIPVILGAFVSAIVVSSHGLQEQGPGGIGGVPDIDNDPTGSKTINALIITWILVVLLTMVFLGLGFLIIPGVTIDYEFMFVICIILCVFGAFGFRRS